MLYTLFMVLLSNAYVSTCDFEPNEWPENSSILTFSYCVNHASTGDCVNAHAGENFASFTNFTVILDGSGSTVPHSPEDLEYLWIQIDNGAPAVVMDDPQTQNPSFSINQPGNYEFELLTNWYCRSDTDRVSVTLSTFTPSAVNAEFIAGRGGDTAIQVTYASPADERLFIVYKSGIVVIIENGVELPAPFLDISSWVSSQSEQGLLGLAFDPDYEGNGQLYVNYTGQTPNGSGSFSDTRIVSFLRDALDPNVVDQDANSLLMTIEQPESNHNGGQLAFGPDGFLYISTGDGGGAGDNHGIIGNGQDPLTLLGKILRIEVDGLSPYTIPADNPFLGDPGTLDEIWALGLRNPWRCSFDRFTGDFFIADVGQNSWEEINFQPANSMGGENYGWRLKEGLICFNPSSGCDPGGLTDPVWVYGHSGNCSISGGFVYRGNDVYGLQGYYLYGDWCSRRYWVLVDRDTGWENYDLSVFVSDSLLSENITAFGEDHSGELYICTTSGGAKVYKITEIRLD